MYPCWAALMRILFAPSALNLTAAARRRSGSRSTLDMPNVMWSETPQPLGQAIWLQPGPAFFLLARDRVRLEPDGHVRRPISVHRDPGEQRRSVVDAGQPGR